MENTNSSPTQATSDCKGSVTTGRRRHSQSPAANISASPYPEVTLTSKGIALLAAALAPAVLASQQPAMKDSTAAAPKPSAPAFDFSGIVFANYQYRTDAPSRDANKFDVERAYLTFRVPAGDRASVRITTDLYQQTSSGADAFYKGWSVRAKYAYFQYNYLNGPAWKATARVGLLHTVFIEHDEQFWPRWIANSPTEKSGFFSSADAGIATSVSLPKKSGELYATITNGPGYTSRETDRFKDFAARLTVTPWATNSGSILKTVALSAWAYKGATASKFVSGGVGQVRPVGEALQRDRWGVHVGGTMPGITFGAQYAQRIEEGETGSNTPTAPRGVIDSTGTLTSAYALIRPVVLFNSAKSHPLSIIGRWDRNIANRDTEDAWDFFVAGAVWDLSSKASVSLDYQESMPARGEPVAPSKTWFFHVVARF